MTSWRRIGSRRLQGCSIFNLDPVRFEPPDGRRARDIYVLEAPDWINVVPLTDDRRVVLVRQYRFGIEGFTLEIPGGMCDHGESPAEAALRELREETGYGARELIALGWVHPNPALQTNRCHSFLAAGAHRARRGHGPRASLRGPCPTQPSSSVASRRARSSIHAGTRPSRSTALSYH